jgi:hypothetical protein
MPAIVKNMKEHPTNSQLIMTITKDKKAYKTENSTKISTALEISKKLSNTKGSGFV